MTNDPCCALCKGAHGICLSRHTCQHHLAADAQDELNHRARKVYANPTSDIAIKNVMNERRRQR